MDTSHYAELALTSASELAKQLISVASAVLVLTVTLVEKFRSTHIRSADRFLIVSWTLLVLSVLAGFWSLMALTGTLVAAQAGAPLKLEDNARIPAGIQVITFFLGVLFFMWYGLVALRSRANK